VVGREETVANKKVNKGISTTEQTFQAFVKLNNVRKVPRLLLNVTEKIVSCVGPFAPSATCKEETIVTIRGPIGSYDTVDSVMSVRKLFEQKQEMIFTITTPTDEKIKFESKFQVKALKFEENLLRFLTDYMPHIERQHVTTRTVLQGLAGTLASLNLEVVQ
jgi:hypothetical protein